MSQNIHVTDSAASSPASPLPEAPFRSSPMRVEEAWIDYNGHLNVAYYHVLFDRAVDEFLASLGLGLDYVRGRQASVFALEDHVCYVREVKAGDSVEVDIHLLDHDAKRLHFFMTLTHKDGGFVSATAEHLSMHVDLTTRKSAPFPPDVLATIERTASAHSGLARPERAGRSIGIRRRPG